jgi:hypothetical protein
MILYDAKKNTAIPRTGGNGVSKPKKKQGTGRRI